MIYYLKDKPNASGAYPAPQAQPGSGTIPISQEQRDMVVQYNGFVSVKTEADEAGAVSMTMEPNLEAWEAWKESQTEPQTEPTMEDRIAELEAKNAALTTSNQFLEDCLVEMAGVVYA